MGFHVRAGLVGMECDINELKREMAELRERVAKLEAVIDCPKCDGWGKSGDDE